MLSFVVRELSVFVVVPVTQNVLGISWNPNTDNMNVVGGESLIQEESWRYTKRKVLSLVSSIFKMRQHLVS